MNNKKKIIAICVCVALLAGTILSGTIAYFTDNEAIKNTFTSGNVMIDLKEYADNNVVIETDDQESRPFKGEKIYPADVIAKKPVITVGKGDEVSENAYVAAIITVTTAKDLSGVSTGKTSVVTNGKLNPEPLIQSAENSGILNNATDCDNREAVLSALESGQNAVYQTTSNDGDKKVYTFYLFVADAKANNETVTLFDKLVVPSDWDNDEMDLLDTLSIKVDAYAVQEKNLSDCLTAMTSAFDAFSVLKETTQA